MKPQNNQEEVQLLKENPGALVAHYQTIVKIVVSKFIARGFFSYDEQMEVVQQVNEALLSKKIESIQRNYNGSVLLSTYFSKVVYNLCIEVTRKQKKVVRSEAVEVLEKQAQDETSAFDKMVIKDELNRLQLILKTIIKPTLRLYIALKLYAKAVLFKSDFHGELVVEDELYRAFIADFFDAYDDWNDKEVYKKAVPFLNKLTRKKADPDSFRKWLNMQIDKIIELQNGEPPRAFHNRDSIRILLQLFFEKKIPLPVKKTV